jgi:hypothetical protein
MNYISRFGVYWRIIGRWSYGTTFCGGADGAEWCKGRECCCSRIITIHRSAGDGGSTVKGDGEGVMRIESCSKEKTCNIGQSYTRGERY